MHHKTGSAISGLEWALEAGFKSFQPYSRVIPRQDVMAKKYDPECPLLDHALKVCIRTYAVRHGFNLYDQG